MSVEDDRTRKTGNPVEGARQSSFEKLRFGKLKLLLEYCVLHDTTHQYKEQGGMGHGAWGTGIVGNRSRRTRATTGYLLPGCRVLAAVPDEASTWNVQYCAMSARVCANKGQGPWVGA